MQENKFENRVQQQMEEFRIRPSEAVWQKVEEELRKKKKRRVVFYIFLLAGLSLIGYSGYFLFNNPIAIGSKPNLVQQNTSLPDNGRSGKSKKTVPETGNTTVNTLREKKDVLSFEHKNSNAKEKINSIQTSDIVLKDEETSNEKNFVSKKKERSVVKKISGKHSPVEAIDKDNVNDNSIVTKNIEQTREIPSLQKEAGIPLLSKADISQLIAAGKQLKGDRQLPVPGKNIQIKRDSITEEIAANNKEEIPAKTKRNKQSPKINWGIELSGGISSPRDNAFSLGERQKSLASADYFSAPANITGGGGNPGVFYLPSSIQSGSAFRAGLAAEMKISEKSSISSGLRYAYFSNSIQVGTYKDTAVTFSNSFSQAVRVDAIYRGYHQEEYINRFHFIQLPLQYQLQLNKGVKMPVLWNVGASVGYLVSTNGLVYDTTASGIYYHDKDAFNKFHLNLTTGFSFRFGSKNKSDSYRIQWSLGPELSLGMNKLTKDDYTRKQYLLYGGITGRIIFAKKK